MLNVCWKRLIVLSLVTIAVCLVLVAQAKKLSSKIYNSRTFFVANEAVPTSNAAIPNSAQAEFTRHLVIAADGRTLVHVRYVPDYVRIPYPGGDVPADTGVCSDEIVRIYRQAGVDLQKEVHEDMVKHFREYPHPWAWRVLRGPDPNIDHRRVPNLMVFFRRNGENLSRAKQAQLYVPGDVVAWDLGAGTTHIGMVTDKINPRSGRYMILHNIGAGPQIEDVLFDWLVIGHYRYYGPQVR